MDLLITKKIIDECRSAIKEAKPYTEDEIFDGSEISVGDRRKATYAKNILEHYNIDPYNDNDYGNIKD